MSESKILKINIYKIRIRVILPDFIRHCLKYIALTYPTLTCKNLYDIFADIWPNSGHILRPHNYITSFFHRLNFLQIYQKFPT